MSAILRGVGQARDWMRLEGPKGQITTVADWLVCAPPKRGTYHWRDGRSAKELAKAWCGHGEPRVPGALAEHLERLIPVAFWSAAHGWAEHRVDIDELPGEPPNLDLALVVPNPSCPTVVCVEAKADETFGAVVFAKLAEAAAVIAADGDTGVPNRILGLRALLQPWSPGLPHVGELRYQLLTAAAATAKFAARHGARVAILVVHEFRSVTRTRAKLLTNNENDLRRFLSRLGGAGAGRQVSPFGPFSLAGFGGQFFVAKITTDLDQLSPPASQP